jgi:phosphoglycolate phosphatase
LTHFQGLLAVTTIRCRDKVFQNIQAVLFDKDGTLADAESFLKSLGQKRSRLIDAQVPGVQEPLLMAFGLEGQLNPAGLLAVGSRRENEIAAAAYVAETGRDWLESMEIACSGFAEADKYLKRKADHTPLIDGGLDLLKSLAIAEFRVGFLSSDTTENVRDFVQKYQLESYIQLQMGIDQGPTKPDPVLFQQACASLGVAPETTLMIGDSQADIKMADAAGAAGCIGFTGGWTTPIHLDNADVAIAQFDEVQVVG